MDAANNKYELSSTQFEEALSILNKERQETIFTKRQQRIYKLLKLSIVGYITTSFGYVIFGLITQFKAQQDSGIYVVLLGMFVILLAVSLLMTIIAFFLSLPLIIKLRRQL